LHRAQGVPVVLVLVPGGGALVIAEV
jgi:hypothetical protein